MEYWDIYDQEGNYTGKTIVKGSELQKEEYHLAMEAWIINNEGQILIQQRSNTCELLPGVWGLTTGRMIAGEDTITGCIREIKEELGVEIEKNETKFIRRIVRQDSTQLIWDVYFIKKEIQLKMLTLQIDEVAQAKWVSLDEFRKMVEVGEIFNYPEIYEILNQVIGLKNAGEI